VTQQFVTYRITRLFWHVQCLWHIAVLYIIAGHMGTSPWQFLIVYTDLQRQKSENG